MGPPDTDTLADFYRTLSSLSFTLVGLWWVVIQLRYKDGQGDVMGRRHSYNVLLFFLSPGIMSLLAAVNVDSPAIWRTAFTITAVLGLIEVGLYLAGAVRRTQAADLLRAVGLVDYVLIGLIALAPQIAWNVGLRALEAEAFLLTGLVLIGVHMVFFEIVRPPDAPRVA